MRTVVRVLTIWGAIELSGAAFAVLFVIVRKALKKEKEE